MVIPFEDYPVRLQFWLDSRQCGQAVRALASVVQRLDNAMHQINLYLVDSAISFPNTYPLDSVISFPNTYPLDSDLSGG